MNKRIEELAVQAGFKYIKEEGIGWAGNYNSSLDKFAELVAAAERDACAKVCEDWPNGRDDVYLIAAAIRERGKNANG